LQAGSGSHSCDGDVFFAATVKAATRGARPAA
jgi:hypothetical protein